MSQAEHQKAIKAALTTGDRLGVLFARIGTKEHPRGAVLTAYRTARRALSGRIGEPAAVLDTLRELRHSLEATAVELLRDAAALGIEQAGAELAAYGLDVPGVVPGGVQMTPALDAILGLVDGQAQQVQSLALAGVPGAEEMILGDADRVGLLSPAPVMVETARWLAILVGLGWTWMVGAAFGGDQAGAVAFRKQAIAAIDERTTDCCLRVHGQVQPLNRPFILTGVPRFADRMDWMPFHWW